MNEMDLYADPELRKPFAKIAKRMNQYLRDKFGIMFNYGDLDVEWDSLPRYIIDRGDGRFHVLKVLGLYTDNDTGRKKIRIDESLYGKRLYKVIEHEVVHYAQDKLGSIKNLVSKYRSNARKYIEKYAEFACETIFGKRKIPEYKIAKALSGA